MVLLYKASDRTFWPIYGPEAGYLLMTEEELKEQQDEYNANFDKRKAEAVAAGAAMYAT